MRLDILFVADVRFEGGTSTALAVEIRAAARAGLKTGLLAVKGPLLGHPYPMHPDLRALVDGGATARIDPDTKVEADLVLLHHPTIMSNRFTRRTGIKAERLVMVLHHPMVDRLGKLQYDLARIISNCHWAFGVKVWLAPVSAIDRDALPRRLPAGAELLPEDWTNLIDLDDWPRRPDGPPHNPVVIGRHARPDKLKWPNRATDALRIYPADAARYCIRILGGDTFLEEIYGPLPRNWELLPFAWTGIAEFLQGLDFYVYYHSDSWSEAFGRTILEALAVGLVTILPAHFQPLFGDAAIYAVPRDVERTIARFVADPDAYARQSALARAFVAAHHSAELFVPRLNRLFDLPHPAAPAADRTSMIRPLPIRHVLFASTNGIGMGHLAQQMAVARRLPEGLKPVFATMSYAMKIAADEGYHAHFLTYHRSIDAAPDDWNDVLAEELFDLISHLRPAVFAYDATAVFDGVAAALAMDPNLFSIWVRRPMWRESHRPFLEMADAFDAVIEPGELADEFDHGPTSEVRDRVLLVPPVLLLEPSQRLDRAAARKFLDIPDGMTVVALQLGSGSNFDMRGVRSSVLKALLDRPNTLVLDIRSPIRADFGPDDPVGPRHRVVELFPSFRYSRAFDAAVVAPGYNTFHENVLGAVPTLFVPNEADEMDLQLNRARWAELGGFGLLMRRDHDLPHVDSFIERLLDPAERDRMAARCSTVIWTNGADEIARYIEDHARIVRTDWDITSEPRSGRAPRAPLHQSMEAKPESRVGDIDIPSRRTLNARAAKERATLKSRKIYAHTLGSAEWRNTLAVPTETKPAGITEGPAVEFSWEGRPVRLHFPFEDDHIADMVRSTKTFYEIEMLRDVRARLFFAKCAVDVGAHVGNHTVFFAHALGLRTVAFEPNPAAFHCLEANVSANALRSKCRLHNVAVGKEPGRASLRLHGAERNSGAVAVTLADQGDIEVVTLDEALRGESQVDIIKIDVEGFEVSVLEGALETISNHRPIVYVETTERDFAAVCHILTEARYVCWMRFNYAPTFLFLPQERFYAARTLLADGIQN